MIDAGFGLQVNQSMASHQDVEVSGQVSREEDLRGVHSGSQCRPFTQSLAYICIWMRTFSADASSQGDGDTEHQ